MRAILLGLLIVGTAVSTALLFKPVRRYIASFFMQPPAPPRRKTSNTSSESSGRAAIRPSPHVRSSGSNANHNDTTVSTFALSVQTPRDIVSTVSAPAQSQDAHDQTSTQDEDEQKTSVQPSLVAQRLNGHSSVYLNYSPHTKDELPQLTSLDSLLDCIIEANLLCPIKVLCLSKHKLTQAPVGLCALQDLEELDLSYNPITSFSESFYTFIKKHRSLKKLKLLGCPLEPAALEALQQCNKDRINNQKPEVLLYLKPSTGNHASKILSPDEVIQASKNRANRLMNAVNKVSRLMWVPK